MEGATTQTTSTLAPPAASPFVPLVPPDATAGGGGMGNADPQPSGDSPVASGAAGRDGGTPVTSGGSGATPGAGGFGGIDAGSLGGVAGLSSSAGTGGSAGSAEAGAGGLPTCPEGQSCEPSCAGCFVEGDCIAAGTPNPSNPCQVCDPVANASAFTNDDGAWCDDGQYCTIDDACSLGVCSGQSRECDDAVNCNGVGTCDEDSDQCVEGQSECSGDDVCDVTLDECVSLCDGCLISGQCIPDGQQAPGNPCLVCDVSVADDAYSAEVGKACGQAAATCSAQDTCDAQGACQANHTAAGLPCGSATASTCNGADTCDGAGSCLTNVAANGTTCDDGQYCTTSSACQGGSCVGTQNRSCASNEQCNEQTDACTCPGCVIAAACVASGTVNPSNACQICSPAVSAVAYSPNTGANCGSGPATCSGQDTCNSSGTCQPNHSPNGTSCTGGECQSGTCEPFTNPFDCVAPDPPEVILPSDRFLLTGEPPANTGGTIPNGTYTPVRIDGYDEATQVDLMSFEFSNGFVQLGFRNYWLSNGLAPIGEIQFAGSVSISGANLTWDVERCDPQYNLDPPNIEFTVLPNGLRTEQLTLGDRVVVTYQRN